MIKINLDERWKKATGPDSEMIAVAIISKSIQLMCELGKQFDALVDSGENTDSSTFNQIFNTIVHTSVAHRLLLLYILEFEVLSEDEANGCGLKAFYIALKGLDRIGAYEEDEGNAGEKRT